jgi:pimeloyl-ACP methyl ester carboxylesterase
MNTSEHWVTTPQGRLYAQRWTPAADTGRAPLLLFHDSLGCVALWRDWPAALAQATGRSVVAYDRLGFGRSDPCSDTLTPAFVQHEAAANLPALCEQLGLHQFVAFGHSVGGGMAMHVAAHAGPRCVGLVTESAQVFAEDHTLAGIRSARTQFADPAQLERLARYHGTKARWVVDAWTDTWLASDFADWSLDAVLPQVHCPALVMHGRQDEFGTLLHPQRIAAGLAGPVQTLLLDCGHVPHRELPEPVLAAVADWLRPLA